MRVQSPTDLGFLLRERRRALGLSQAVLARRMGVSRQWIVQVEAGKPGAELGLVLQALVAVGLALEGVSTDPPRPGTPHESESANPGGLDDVIARTLRVR